MDTFKLLISQLLKVYIYYFFFGYSLKHCDMPKDFGFNLQSQSVYLSMLLFFMVLEPFAEVV